MQVASKVSEKDSFISSVTNSEDGAIGILRIRETKYLNRWLCQTTAKGLGAEKEKLKLKPTSNNQPL